MDILKKAGDLLWEATFGLLRSYQDKTVELAKIEAVSLYVKSVQVVRQHLLFLIAVLFSLMVVAVTLLVVPIALILCAPWTVPAKAIIIFVFGVVYLSIPAVILFQVFSEKRWMQITLADEWLGKVTNNKN